MKRVDPEALYRFIRDRWGSTANIVCPEVAEPEQPKYDYHADWTRHPDPSGNNDVHFTCNYCGVYRDRPPKAPHDHAECRARTRKQPTPSYPETPDSSPDPYDYHADWTRHPDPSGNNDVHWTCKYCDHWTDYRPKARHNCHEQPTPTEPVIDEAVYREAARVALGAEIGHWSNGWRTAITAAIRKYEELRGVRLVGHNDTQTRSKACGGSSGASSSLSDSSLASSSVCAGPATPPDTSGAHTTSTAAPAADLMLTDSEIGRVWDRWDIPSQHDNILATAAGWRMVLPLCRAVADAQLAKANAAAKPVTISEAELKRWWTSQTNLGDLFALLRRHGVEVTSE